MNNPHQRREQIAETAWRVIEREGVSRASLREIAREGGYTTGVLSYYFRDKQELLAYALGLVVDRQVERLGRVAPQRGLQAALAELLPLDAERRRECVIWLALTTASLQQPDLATELQRRCAQARTAMSSALSDALASSSPTEDIDDLSDELQALIDGITVNALGQPERYPPERQLAVLGRALGRLGRMQAASPRLSSPST